MANALAVTTKVWQYGPATSPSCGIKVSSTAPKQTLSLLLSALIHTQLQWRLTWTNQNFLPDHEKEVISDVAWKFRSSLQLWTNVCQHGAWWQTASVCKWSSESSRDCYVTSSRSLCCTHSRYNHWEQQRETAPLLLCYCCLSISVRWGWDMLLLWYAAWV